ncbi:class I SAM-dependent methyltransferase [Fulvivirgaceae bacterium BMA10]|uniref:Class I SAM-dependent methyltransferase n=1 Tax=Splendidivirga corallicola TaxID=3051826 RepID=A0ABT8KTQ9_9BACT|nr:class I SAM-dependent methyltransferase [Fulvivirgaceae bacterium BMA10]
MDKAFKEIFDQVFNEYKKTPIDIFGNGKGEVETQELEVLKLTYERTIRDITNYFKPVVRNFEDIKILEIGPWVGFVSTVLKRIGFNISVQEIPDFVCQKNLKAHFENEQINYSPVNLRHYKLPFHNEEFDAIIMCEVLEHLNFNPLPVLSEINRILKMDGLYYLSLPNLVSLPNRLKFLFGKSVNTPIQKFFDQLKPGTSEIIGIHWREYTTEEIRQLLEATSFHITRQYLFHHGHIRNPILKLLLFLPYKFLPGLLPNQTTLAIKTENCQYDFFFSDVTKF